MESNSSPHVVPGGSSNYGPPFGADFIPNLQYITNITQAFPAVVTFLDNTNFTVAEWISFRVPPPNGMIQLNNQKAQIISLTPNTVTIAVDTTNFYPFIYVQDPQVPCVAVPAGSGIIQGTTTVTLEDAFDNQPVF
jgi:hypothetical protein